MRPAICKIGPRRARSLVVTHSDKRGPKHIHTKGEDKEMSKGQECSEDEEATLPKVKKLTRPLSLQTVQVNHPTRREENTTSHVP